MKKIIASTIYTMILVFSFSANANDGPYFVGTVNTAAACKEHAGIAGYRNYSLENNLLYTRIPNTGFYACYGWNPR